jgi:hypothetical protein
MSGTGGGPHSMLPAAEGISAAKERFVAAFGLLPQEPHLGQHRYWPPRLNKTQLHCVANE